VADMESSIEFTLFALLPASLHLEPNSEPPRTVGMATTPPNSWANVKNSGEKNGSSDQLLSPNPYETVINSRTQIDLMTGVGALPYCRYGAVPSSLVDFS
jgi:hypothetical protein